MDGNLNWVTWSWDAVLNLTLSRSKDIGRRLFNSIKRKICIRKTRNVHRKIQQNSILTQSLRKPVTLNEYMPKEMRMKTPTESVTTENIFVAYYHVDEVKNHTEPVITNSLNLFHGLCTTKISFNDEDMLLWSKFYN